MNIFVEKNRRRNIILEDMGIEGQDHHGPIGNGFGVGIIVRRSLEFEGICQKTEFLALMTVVLKITQILCYPENKDFVFQKKGFIILAVLEL